MGWGIETKLPVTSRRDLSLIYTPGVGECCLKIKENSSMAIELTNKVNSIAVVVFEDKKELAEALAANYRDNGFDAYPIILKKTDFSTQKIVESLSPNFSAFDLSLLSEKLDLSNINASVPKRAESFCIPDMDSLPEDVKAASVKLHFLTRGVIKQINAAAPPRLVGVVSNGSAVLGFGNIGAQAALPVMEGKSALFKVFGDVDAIPLCVDAKSIDDFIKIVQALEPTFAGINLEDICAPDCFDVEEELINTMKIPVFHDDQHGTAIVVLSGLINALKLLKKKKDDIKVVFSGAGAAAIAVCKLFLAYGVKNIIMTDKNGIVYSGRECNDSYLEKISEVTNLSRLKGTLADAIVGADVFVGLSAPGVLSGEMIKTMAEKPVIFALANPTPEIMPNEAKNAGAYIVATGRSDFPNQINNSLVFPGVFKGILASNVKIINNSIKLQAAEAIAASVTNVTPENIIPDPMDKNVASIVSAAILNCQKI